MLYIASLVLAVCFAFCSGFCVGAVVMINLAQDELNRYIVSQYDGE